MKGIDVSGLLNHGKLLLIKHSPEILTGIGVVGVITSAIMAVRATPKALTLVYEEVVDRTDCDMQIDLQQLPTLLPPKDVIFLTWKCYIPSFVTGGLSVACIIGGQRVNLRRNVALSAAYSLSEAAFREYREKITDTFGEKKERSVRDEIAKDRLERQPVSSSEIIITEKGNTLCFDCISGRYFKSDIEKIRQTVNQLNYRLEQEMFISLNEFYYELGLRPVKLGEDNGWNVNDGLIDINYSSNLAEDGTPCLVMDFYVGPRWDYRDLR